MIVNISVRPAPQGGSVLDFSARMGALSRGQIGAPRRIEGERYKLMRAVADMLPPASAPPPVQAAVPVSRPSENVSLIEQLRQLSEMHASGALTDAEFATVKGRLLG